MERDWCARRGTGCFVLVHIPSAAAGILLDVVRARGATVRAALLEAVEWWRRRGGQGLEALRDIRRWRVVECRMLRELAGGRDCCEVLYQGIRAVGAVLPVEAAEYVHSLETQYRVPRSRLLRAILLSWLLELSRGGAHPREGGSGGGGGSGHAPDNKRDGVQVVQAHS